jgi:hypothetical protein
LSVNSSHADCRPERSFFFLRPRARSRRLHTLVRVREKRRLEGFGYARWKLGGNLSELARIVTSRAESNAHVRWSQDDAGTRGIVRR